jgi:O-acetyl-ADP-ribose deacetylase (regulator of RNase III)
MTTNFLKGRLKYMTGDATVPESGGHRLIIQINNDLGVIGAGFSGALNRRWPKVGEEYKRWARSQQNFKGGEIQTVAVQSDTTVVNMIAQHGILSKTPDGALAMTGPNDPPIRYEQLEKCLEKVAALAKFNGSSVHAPRIGAGLAGGDWAKIEAIIIDKLVNKGINVTIYDLPNASTEPSQVRPKFVAKSGQVKKDQLN